MKIIPAIDLMEGKVVRLYKGDPEKKTIYSDNPIDIAKKWERSGADMIHLVDLDATLNRGSNFEIIKKLVPSVSIPVEVAGGLRNESIINDTLGFASRVVVGTLAFQEKKILENLLNSYGEDRIVISVDHIDGKIMINGWQKDTGKDLLEAIKSFKDMGFSNFLLTNVSKDGTLEGPDLKFLELACNIENANIISSGGISSLSDVSKVKEKKAYGVILGKALYENKISIEEAKKIS